MEDFTTSNYHRVIVIDDNPAIHADFRKILTANDRNISFAEAAEDFLGEPVKVTTGLDVELSHANQGEQGLAICKKSIESGKPFGVAFVDMRMPPGWNGIKTISELWQVDPHLQVVICSAHSDYLWSEIHRKFGNTDRLLILKKPFDNAEVLQLTSALIKKRQLIELTTIRNEGLEVIVNERTQHLREAKRETDLLISAIDSILIGLDADGKITLWNSQSETTFGLDSTQATGKVFTDLPINWEDKDQIKQCINNHSKRFEAIFHDQSADHRIVGMSSFQISDDRVHKGNLLIGTELTESRTLESQLHQAQKLESVGKLAAGVAHEINTPMQYIGDNLEFLAKKVGKLTPLIAVENTKAKSVVGDLLEAINDSRDGVQHVSQIVLALKKLAHPGLTEKVPVDVNKALASIIAVTTNEWRYVAKITTLFDETAPTVPALPVELNQVFLNILVNAAHAVSEVTEGGANGKGEITVATKRLDDSVRVSISDSGTGIPEDIKDRIFDPFFTTKEVGKGTGQGLSITHTVVVKKHAGRLACDSVLGEGTTFTIEIPLQSDDLAKAESETRTDPTRTETTSQLQSP